MIPAITAANEFIKLGVSEPTVPDVDQMKLQKLLFYAHAWHLALRDEALLNETFEAWPWGPVIDTVYYQTRRFGRNKIDQKLTMSIFSGGHAQMIVPELEDQTDREREFVQLVWDRYKNYTAIQLSNATHREGEPWAQVKELYGNLDSRPTIPNDLIREIFRKKLKDARSNTAHPG